MSHAELRSLRALAAAICAATALTCHAAAPSADHADVTWRIPASVWMDDARFAELTRLFSDNSLSGKDLQIVLQLMAGIYDNSQMPVQP